MSLSDSSGLSSPPSSDDEMAPPYALDGKTSSVDGTPRKVGSPSTTFSVSPSQNKRAPSPPHEEVLADNPDIAFIVMFRSRFSDAFPSKMPHLGPQDVERGVVDSIPSTQIEHLLCNLLSLVLNRTKPVAVGSYHRALNDAIVAHKHQWPSVWNKKNPLPGERIFNSLSPKERLSVIKALILWSLNSSDLVKRIIAESYKQSRHDDDLNQPLSVQPWGRDGQKRTYWLIEGQNDTFFRLYRQSDTALKHVNWWSVAGSVDELRGVAEKLKESGPSQAAKRLSERITNALPRFEATEEKRKRREYRQASKEKFRPEVSYSYEGRTRGKRMRYTYEEADEEQESEVSARRSGRLSRTPAEASGPTVTASGRQVRSRFGGTYGEMLLSGQSTARATPATADYARSEASEEPRGPGGRATRSRGKPMENGGSKKRKHIETYNSVDELDDEDDAESTGNEWDGGDDEDDIIRANDQDDDEEMSDISDDEPLSLIVKLKLPKGMKLEDTPSSTLNGQSSGAPPPAPLLPKSEPAVNGHTLAFQQSLANGAPAVSAYGSMPLKVEAPVMTAPLLNVAASSNTAAQPVTAAPPVNAAPPANTAPQPALVRTAPLANPAPAVKLEQPAPIQAPLAQGPPAPATHLPVAQPPTAVPPPVADGLTPQVNGYPAISYPTVDQVPKQQPPAAYQPPVTTGHAT